MEHFSYIFPYAFTMGIDMVFIHKAKPLYGFSAITIKVFLYLHNDANITLIFYKRAQRGTHAFIYNNTFTYMPFADINRVQYFLLYENGNLYNIYIE